MHIDSNFLIRMLTADDPKLADVAFQRVSEQKSGSIIILPAVVSEICFVLEFHDAYRLNHRQIADGLLAFFDSEHFKDDATVRRALEVYKKEPQLDFVDCLLIVKSGAKAKNVLTFDKKLVKALE